MIRRSTLQGRIAVRTVLAVFGCLLASGAAVVTVAARTTVAQVENRMTTLITPLLQGPIVEVDVETRCRVVTSGSPVDGEGRSEFVLELHGPAGQVCRRPNAPALEPLVPSSTSFRLFTGSDLPQVESAERAPILVRTQELTGGWTARIGADLSGFGVLASRLLRTMFVISLGGALVAAWVGRTVARTGLRPVRELADAAETIARTQDLSVRIDVPPGRSDDEIDRLADAFNRMTGALSEARDRQARLVADAGHELRTPLTSLRANLELLVRSEQAGRPLPPEHRSALLADVSAQLGELTHLVDGLVVLARDEPDRPRAAGRLDEITHRAVDRARRRATGHTLDVAVRPWLVPDADAELLERAVVNLLDNALKFAPPGSTVRVRLADGELTVDDEGPGLAAELRTKAFERFWRSDDARALPGSGLGLAIVADAVAAHGGTARLAASPSGGTRAVLAVPGGAPPTQPTS